MKIMRSYQVDGLTNKLAFYIVIAIFNSNWIEFLHIINIKRSAEFDSLIQVVD